MLTVDCWTLWGAACLCLKAPMWSHETIWKNQRDRGSDRRLSAPSSCMTDWLPAYHTGGACFSQHREHWAGVWWVELHDPEAPVSGSCCGSSGEGQGRGERDQSRALTFSIELNIASACLAGPIKKYREQMSERDIQLGRGYRDL